MLIRLIVSRIAYSIVTLLLLSLLIFFTIEILPGDIAQRVLGRQASEQAKQNFREKLRLDLPVHERYLSWLQGVFQGNLGQALTSSRTVVEIIIPGLRNTILIGGLAFLLHIPLSFLLAMVAANFRGRPLDITISLSSFLGLSTPEFVLGPILLILFAVKWPLFPVVSLVDASKSPLGNWRALVLPTLTLMIIMSAYTVRMLRDNLIDVLNSEYVRMARMKGIASRRIVLRHALPNALIPTLNVAALNLSYLISGVVIVERVFSYPGLGTLLVEAVKLRDVPVIEAIVLMSAATYILANLLADIFTILLHPKLRTS